MTKKKTNNNNLCRIFPLYFFFEQIWFGAFAIRIYGCWKWRFGHVKIIRHQRFRIGRCEILPRKIGQYRFLGLSGTREKFTILLFGANTSPILFLSGQFARWLQLLIGWLMTMINNERQKKQQKTANKHTNNKIKKWMTKKNEQKKWSNIKKVSVSVCVCVFAAAIGERVRLKNSKVFGNPLYWIHHISTFFSFAMLISGASVWHSVNWRRKIYIQYII